MSDGVLDALGKPQRMLKEAISGDENEWFSYDPDSVLGRQGYAIGNTALDLLVDPIDLAFPVLGKGAKALGKLAGHLPESGRGMFASGFSNYVNNYYGPAKDRGLTTLERLVEKPAAALYKAKKGVEVPPDKTAALAQKTVGMGETFAEGMINQARNILNPRARAQFKESGISGGTQRILRRHAKNAANDVGRRNTQKMVAQMQYVRNILTQSDRSGAIDPRLLRLTDEMSNLKTAAANTGNTVGDMMLDHRVLEDLPQVPKLYKGKGGQMVTRRNKKTGDLYMQTPTKDTYISEADAAFINKHVNNATGNPDVVTMKRPEQVNTGKHRYDVLGKNNIGYSSIETIFKTAAKNGDEVTNAYLGRELAKIRVKGRKEGNPKFTLEAAEDGTGYWISNGTNASAITEGGINALIKVSPDGSLIGIMSDRHDWLEKLMGEASSMINKAPGVNVNIEGGLLPTSLAAVSPPMFKNVYDTKLTKKALGGNPAPAGRGPYRRETGSDYATVANQDSKFTDPINEVLELRGSNTGMMAEVLRDAQKLSAVASVSNRLPEDE